MKKILLAAVLSCGFAVEANAQCAFSVNASTTNVICNGGANGTAALQVIGGSGSYVYQWLSPLNATTQTVNNVPAGTHQVLVTDVVASCTDTVDIIITEPSPIVISVTQLTPSNCGFNNGSFTVLASGGNSSFFQYSANGSTPQASGTFNNMVGGAYTVTATDALGCTATIFVAVNDVQMSAQLISQTNASCSSVCDGLVSVLAAGGAAPISYELDNSGITFGTGNLTGLCAGNHIVTVYDAGFCVASVMFTITAPPGINVAYNTTPSSCTVCNGTITLNASGGTGAYQYSADYGATFQASNIFTGLCQGFHMVGAIDGNNCSYFTNVYVANTSTLSVQLTSTPPTSCNSCDGQILAIANSGTPPYTYLWNVPGVLNTPLATGVCGNTTCGVTVTDANGCFAFATILSLPGAPFTIGFDTVQLASCGNCNGTIIANPSGGVQPYSYAWNGVGSSNDSLATGLCSYLGATVSITDGTGCISTSNFSPFASSIPGLSVTHTSTPESFPGASDGSIDITVSGTSTPLSYIWLNGATTQDIFSLTSGTYVLYISDTTGNCYGYSVAIQPIPPVYGMITGTIYHDSNMNCTKEVSEAPINLGTVNIAPGGYIGYNNYSGGYGIWVPAGNYTISHTPGPGTSSSPGCTTSYNAVINSSTTLVSNIDFADTVVNNVDVSTSISSTPIVPGFNGTYYLSRYNNLPMVANGTMMFILPDTLSYISSSVLPSAISGDTLWFNYSNLSTNMWSQISISFSTPANPGLLGTILTACASITANNSTDINLANNAICHQRMVTGSYDPNDKSVSPVGEGVSGEVQLTDTEYTYLIRFQNTGNGPAVNIHVDDTLSNLLDMSTFEMLGSSHNYSIITKPGNVIVWKFDNIMLPDSGSNQSASHGWIQFKIKTKPNMVIGNVINNTAAIYFDFNPPIITNTTVNTFVAPDFIPEISSKNNLQVYPNPANDIVTILHPEKGRGAVKITVLDITGRAVKNISATGIQTQMDVKDLAPGTYILHALCNQTMYTTRFIRR